MAEKRTPVTTVRVDYMCEECGEAVEYTGRMHPAFPPLHIHSCPLGHVFKSYDRYPWIDYRPVD